MVLQVGEKELGETIKEKCKGVYHFLQDLYRFITWREGILHSLRKSHGHTKLSFCNRILLNVHVNCLFNCEELLFSRSDYFESYIAMGLL